jgi:hypothetical protein
MEDRRKWAGALERGGLHVPSGLERLDSFFWKDAGDDETVVVFDHERAILVVYADHPRRAGRARPSA